MTFLLKERWCSICSVRSKASSSSTKWKLPLCCFKICQLGAENECDHLHIRIIHFRRIPGIVHLMSALLAAFTSAQCDVRKPKGIQHSDLCEDEWRGIKKREKLLFPFNTDITHGRLMSAAPESAEYTPTPCVSNSFLLSFQFQMDGTF